MGNPTNELRAKLDELGVIWWPDVYYRDTNTCWRVGDFEWRASEKKDGKLLIGCTCVKYLTPEQAVTATVGAGTLTAEQVRECAKGVYFEGYGDGATHRVNGIEETDWQAIADKLNATVGAGTCCYIPDEAGFTWWDENDVEHYEEHSASDECCFASCDKCGYAMMVGDDGWFDGWDEITDWWEEDGSYHKGYILKPRFKHCPNCGKRIEEEE